MRQLIYVEIKRLLNRNKIVFLFFLIVAVSILFSAYPIQVETYPILESDQTLNFVRGKEALKAKKDAGRKIDGKVNKSNIYEVFQQYNSVVDTYGENLLETNPNVYFKEVNPILPILTRVQESFAESKNGGIPKELLDITPDEAMKFYEKREIRLLDIIENDLYPGNKNISKAVQNIDKKVNKPLVFKAGFGENVIEYLSILVTVLSLIFVVVFSPIFTKDYQTESYEIIHGTKNFNSKLILARYISMIIITSLYYILAGVIFFSLTVPFYGLDRLTLSFQFNTSAMSIAPLNVGEAQLIIYVVGFLNILVTNSFCFFVSSISRNIRKSVFVCMAAILLPSIIFPMVQNMNVGILQMMLYWLLHILPTFGVGLINSFTLSLSDLIFLDNPFMPIWSPIFLVLISFIEIPLFYVFARRNFLKKKL